MKNIILILSIIITSSSFGQLVNSLPDTGAVTIGTHTPEAGSQLTVNGNTTLKNALEVQGDLVIEGQSILETYVRMPGIANYAGELDNFEILVTDPSGNVTRITRDDLLHGLVALPEGIDACTTPYKESPKWYNAPYKLFTACPDVNVGVGVTNPKYLLHVEGEAYAVRLKVGDKSAESTALISAFVGNNSQDLLTLGKKIGEEDQTITFKIANDGTVYSHEINVRIPTSFPDYVFDDDYDLMSLVSLEKYINKNKHLPNIPSASEIEREGLNIARFQYLMVEKVEELTLYSIGVDQKNKRLQNENEILKKRLDKLESEIELVKELVKK